MITLERAQALIAAGIAEASAQGLNLAFAVVDAAGHPVASARMDGAPWIAPEVALGKAGRRPPTARRAPRRATR